MNHFTRRLVFGGSLLALPVVTWAQGAAQPAAGPVNSAMGGAGTALPNESLGALMFNPALIAVAPGNQISFTNEFFKDSINIDTTLTAGGRTHRGLSDNQLNIVPAFGWMSRHPEKKMALGFGLIGLGGFSTDYPQDTASVLFAQRPDGLGRVFSTYSVAKIPLALGYQATPKLSLGASVNIYVGQFSMAPLWSEAFDDAYAGPDARWYPEAGRPSQKFAVAGQLGFLYQASTSVSVGASITTPQNFGTYEWNSTIADPTSIGFGTDRTLTYDLDGPWVVSFGVGWKPGKKTQIAADGMFTKYKGVDGFGGAGGIVNGVVHPFGWGNVWTLKAGVQYLATEKLTVRAGYNFSETPLRSEVVMSSVIAPLANQQRINGGFGYKVFPFLEANASFSYAPREHVTGPYRDLDDANHNHLIIGTVDVSNSVTSALIGLSFKF
jgi:long-chain fatty acid transport protein